MFTTRSADFGEILSFDRVGADRNMGFEARTAVLTLPEGRKRKGSIMKIVVGAAAAACAALLAAPAIAYDMKGVGTARCDVLVQAFSNAGDVQKKEFITGIGQWAFGYLTGRNAELPRDRRKALDPLTSDDTAVFVLNTCNRYPNAVVYQIVDLIFDELPYNTPGA
jgi:hypothetical protein